MEKEIINLTEENYTQYIPLDPIAFSLSESGAMGTPGQIIIVDKNRRVYSYNIADIRRELGMVIIPALYEFITGAPRLDWHYYNLWMGNHLMVNDSIHNEFSLKAREYRWQIGVLYQKWLDLVLECI